MSGSQMDRLPKLKPLKLPSDALKPPSGSKLVGALPDGTPIWEGPVFKGNPFFQQGEGPSESGIKRTPIMDSEGKQRWTYNRATGVKITPMESAEFEFETRKFIMVDMGNGNAGPRPVPGLSPEEESRRARQKRIDSFMQNLATAAVDQGYDTAEEFVQAFHSAMDAGAEEVPDKPPPRKRKT